MRNHSFNNVFREMPFFKRSENFTHTISYRITRRDTARFGKYTTGSLRKSPQPFVKISFTARDKALKIFWRDDEPARHECPACSLLRPEKAGVHPLSGNMFDTCVEPALSSEEILRG